MELESYVRYLEIKLEIEREDMKKENERLINEVGALKHSVGNIQTKYQCLQNEFAYIEEDHMRIKDEFQSKINYLQNVVSTLKANNENLEMNNVFQKSKIAILREKNEDLEHKYKNQRILRSLNIFSTNTNDDCRRIVKEVKESFYDLIEIEFKCSICDDLLIDATVTNCNHVFCSYCLKSWKRKRGSNCLCPLCRARLTKDLFKVPVIDEFVNNFTKLVCNESVQNERLKLINERKVLKS